jgi:hypothetical protein
MSSALTLHHERRVCLQHLQRPISSVKETKEGDLAFIVCLTVVLVVLNDVMIRRPKLRPPTAYIACESVSSHRRDPSGHFVVQGMPPHLVESHLISLDTHPISQQ